MVWLATAVVLCIYLVLAWFAATLLHLHGNDLWLLRAALALLGLAGAGAFLWFYLRYKRERQGAGAVPENAVDDEIDSLLHEAEIRLRASKLGSGARLRNLPAIFLIGQQGATKTTIVVHSGADPELLAGRVYDESAVVPTRPGNLWFAHGAILVEVSDVILSQSERWGRLIQKLQPGRKSSKSEPAPRAAVVFVNTETFLQPGAADAAASLARNLRARLHEMSQLLNVNFPVYVLFTKTDRVPFFAEFVRNLTTEEAAQVFGAMLPLQAPGVSGVYGEDANRRFTSAFDGLFYSMADKRTDFLNRENDPEKLAGVYEFPREFRKLRNTLVQFLVDMVRPSQLRTNPFLRGFYFTGVRARIMSDAVATPVPAERREEHEFAIGRAATTLFQMGRAVNQQVQAVPARVAGGRKVPEWVFVNRLFNDVLLRDRPAMGASRVSFKVSYWKRALLGAAAVLCLLAIAVWSISYLRNEKLKNEVLAAMEPMSTPAGQASSVTDLRRLDNLREVVQRLGHYDRDGAPWTMRSGLYIGSTLYPGARRMYFERVHEMLVGPAQQVILTSLQKLPSSPGATDDYGSAYDNLKAYLITTSNHDKSTRMFLTPILLSRWTGGALIEPERLQLARRNFDYYADELKLANPYSSENDTLTIERTRNYLAKFGGAERTYKFIMTEASKENPPVRFQPMVADVVVDTREIPGAFTKAGWGYVQDALQHAERFVPGERWVLGNAVGQSYDPAELQQQLWSRYLAEYIDQWRAFLTAGYVARYTSLNDAVNKLAAISGNGSPLLQLFGLVSKNTATGSPDLARAFQSVQTIVPPAAEERYIGPSNETYMHALVALQASLGQISDPATDKPATDQSLQNAAQALVAARQIAQNFTVYPNAHIETAVEKLMEDPITSAQGLLRGGVSSGLNGKGAEMCGPVRDLMRKFPFDTASSHQATTQELDTVFQPQAGKVWSLYDSTLRNFVTRDGARFVPNPSAGVSINPAFLQFLERADAFTQTVFPAGSSQPHVSFTVRSYQVQGIDDLTLDISGQTITAGAPGQFVWNGSGIQSVTVSGRVGGGTQRVVLLSYEGPWGLFRFFDDADRRKPLGASGESLEWIIKTGGRGQPMRLPDGRPITVKLDVESAGPAPIFRRGYLASLRCEPTVASK